MKVAVVGARRAVQGIGAYVCRAFASAGCEVAGIVGTTPASVEAARAELGARHGLSPAGFTDVAELLERVRPDVLAICSPTHAHRPALQVALAARVHVLCDKPLWWEPGDAQRPRAELEARVRALAQGFRDAGRRLELNAQWPATLPAFRSLHPHAPAVPRELGMLLSPITSGPAMIVDAAPHLLSLLAATAGPGSVRDVRVQGLAGDDSAVLDLAFDWVHARGTTHARLALRRCERQPRPAGYGLDGCWAERQVTLPDYRMELAEGGRSVPLPDPLDAHVAGFVARVAAGEPTDVEGLVESLGNLRDLVAAAEVQRASAG